MAQQSRTTAPESGLDLINCRAKAKPKTSEGRHDRCRVGSLTKKKPFDALFDQVHGGEKHIEYVHKAKNNFESFEPVRKLAQLVRQ